MRAQDLDPDRIPDVEKILANQSALWASFTRNENENEIEYWEGFLKKSYHPGGIRSHDP
jgi:hypothetical protein